MLARRRGGGSSIPDGSLVRRIRSGRPRMRTRISSIVSRWWYLGLSTVDLGGREGKFRSGAEPDVAVSLDGSKDGENDDSNDVAGEKEPV